MRLIEDKVLRTALGAGRTTTLTWRQRGHMPPNQAREGAKNKVTYRENHLKTWFAQRLHNVGEEPPTLQDILSLQTKLLDPTKTRALLGIKDPNELVAYADRVGAPYLILPNDRRMYFEDDILKRRDKLVERTTKVLYTYQEVMKITGLDRRELQVLALRVLGKPDLPSSRTCKDFTEDELHHMLSQGLFGEFTPAEWLDKWAKNERPVGVKQAATITGKTIRELVAKISSGELLGFHGVKSWRVYLSTLEAKD